jgi:hypothetical protein
MSIHALITTIRTSPEPTIFLILNRLNEIFAHFVGSRLRIPMFTQHHISQLGLIPLVNRILFFAISSIIRISRIRVQIPLGRFSLDTQVVTEFALFALVAVSLFVELAYHSLWVNAKGNFLYLDGLEEFCSILFGLFFGGLFGGTTGFFGFFLFLVGVFVGFCLCFELSYLSAGASSFFLSFRVRIVEDIEWAGHDAARFDLHFSYQTSSHRQSSFMSQCF